MPNLITQILQDTSRPNEWHAMVVHFPVVISVLGVGLALLLLVTLGRSHWVRWLTVALYAVGVVAALTAMDAGHDAAEHIHAMHVKLSPQAAAMLRQHAEMGKKVWIFMALTTVLAALTAIPKKPVRITLVVLALVASLSTAGWVAVTGHYGGTLVYQYGVGAPATVNNLPQK